MKKKKKWLRVLMYAVPLWLGYSWLSGTSGVIRQFTLHRHNMALRAQLDSLEQLKKALDSRRTRLQNDTAYLERTARRVLGMAKPGERVFKFYTGTDAPPRPGRPGSVAPARGREVQRAGIAPIHAKGAKGERGGGEAWEGGVIRKTWNRLYSKLLRGAGMRPGQPPTQGRRQSHHD